MIDFLKDYYLQLKFFHILSVICWLAGILYLPRLFYYHTKSFNEDIGNTEIFETCNLNFRICQNGLTTAMYKIITIKMVGISFMNA
jgi:putative membrane protein